MREALTTRQGLGEDAWCSQARKGWWAAKLYSSNDGAGLREAGTSTASTYWIGEGGVNERVTRGRHEDRFLGCRAGSLQNETGIHAIQICYISWGGQSLGHNSVVEPLADAIAGKGYA